MKYDDGNGDWTAKVSCRNIAIFQHLSIFPFIRGECFAKGRRYAPARALA
ncbi:protein of unknown function [Methylocella tundrae]|uniref:Uncharacterized protein n=1 Tax=Methylocella tundrae TaxID=227605 RepID=A0A4U8Z5R1_METTU|nr:protein of unknown function [Methylocella tundrae]